MYALLTAIACSLTTIYNLKNKIIVKDYERLRDQSFPLKILAFQNFYSPFSFPFKALSKIVKISELKRNKKFRSRPT